MNEAEDDLLGELGALEREYDDAFPHAWEDVVRGTRSAEEVAAERLAAGDDPDEVAALAEQLAPPCEAQRNAEREAWIDRLVDAAATSSDQEPAPAANEGNVALYECGRVVYFVGHSAGENSY